MAGRACVRKEGLFLRSCHYGLQSVNVPKHASDKEEEHQHKRARLGGLVGEHRVQRIRRLASRRVGARQNLAWSPPVLGLVARQFEDGRPQVLGSAETTSSVILMTWTGVDCQCVTVAPDGMSQTWRDKLRAGRQSLCGGDAASSTLCAKQRVTLPGKEEWL